jgi:DNA-binding transcriptional regulator YdaS (Cro superfamily)
MNGIKKFYDIYGSQEKAGLAAGVRQQVFGRWLNGIKAPSVRRSIEMEKISGIPRAEIRPDIFGA